MNKTDKACNLQGRSNPCANPPGAANPCQSKTNPCQSKANPGQSNCRQKSKPSSNISKICSSKIPIIVKIIANYLLLGTWCP